MCSNPVEFINNCQISESTALEIRKFLERAEIVEDQRSTSECSSTASGERFYSDTEKRIFDEPDDSTKLIEEEKEENPLEWLLSCLFCSYSDCEYLMFALNSRFVILDKPPSDDKYRILCKRCLEDSSNDITSICLFGLSTPRHSDQLDCVVACIGTSDGFVLFYNHKGILLLYERFSIYEPVKNVHFENVKSSQTLLVVFTKSFFSINPISLNSGLHQAKLQIAKGEKSVKELSETIELQYDHLKPDLKGDIIHVVYTGLYQPSTFEQYLNASWQSFHARVERPKLPTFSTFLITTTIEFASFVWHNREESDQIWTEAVKYTKSLIPTFGIRKYFGISTQPTKKFAHSATASHAPIRSQILDDRVAQNVSISAEGRFVAIADSRARVVLIDILTRTSNILHKGYRDAQIAWSSAREGSKCTEFLVVFAPRRCLMEIWTIVGNVRLCAQHLGSERCKLVQGGDTRMLCGSLNGRHPTNCFLMDHRGELRQILVPFHLALVEPASQDHHDSLILKEMNNMEFTSTKWKEKMNAFKKSTTRRKALEKSLKEVDSVEEAKHLLEIVENLSSFESLQPLPTNIRKAIELYEKMINENAKKETRDDYIENETVRNIIGCYLKNERECDYSEMSFKQWLAAVDVYENDLILKQLEKDDLIRLAILVFSGNFEETSSDLKMIGVDGRQLTNLLSLYIQYSSLDINWDVFNSFVTFLLKFADEKVLSFLEEEVLKSHDIPFAIIGLTLVWCAKMSIHVEKKKQKLDEEQNDDDDDEWDAITPDLEHHDTLLLCLHCAFLSTRLYEREERIEEILSRIDSFARENVARFIIDEEYSVEEINRIFPSDPAMVLGEDEEETKLTIDIPVEKIKIIERVVEIIPKAFEHDLVVLDICWELMTAWFRDKEQLFENIERAVRILNETMNDLCLRVGIGRLIWEKFLAASFETIVKFVEKNARTFKDEEAMKEIGFAERFVIEYVEQCGKLLEIMMESIKRISSTSTFESDRLIETFNSCMSNHGGVMSRNDKLSTIALRHSKGNFHLIEHHYRLALVLQLQLSVGLNIRPLSKLYCATSARAFFIQLDAHPLIPTNDIDDKIIENRHKFLSDAAELGTREDRELAKVLESEWNLNVSMISLTQALSAFRMGNDSLGANELTYCVHNDRTALALLRIVAARILQLGDAEKTTISARHISFLNTLAGDEKGRVVVDGDTEELRNSIALLGKIATSIEQSSKSASNVVKLGDIARQYWSIQWIE